MKTTWMNYTPIQLKLPVDVDLEHVYIDGTKIEANANT